LSTRGCLSTSSVLLKPVVFVCQNFQCANVTTPRDQPSSILSGTVRKRRVIIRFRFPERGVVASNRRPGSTHTVRDVTEEGSSLIPREIIVWGTNLVVQWVELNEFVE